MNKHGAVLGWVAAAPVSARQVCAGVVEESVYVYPEAAEQDRAVPAAGPDCRCGSRKNLDDRGEGLPGEHRQPGPAPEARF